VRNLNEHFDLLKKAWPSAWVARSEIGRFSGGVISARYMANLDSRGQGIKERLRIGRKVVYPVDNLISWLQKKATKIGPKNKA
jgi:phage terminase Nu1 subunit (DNA packaging protein)